MNKRIVTSIILGIAMAGSAVVSYALTPRVKIADAKDKFSLEHMIPTRFGEWQVDTSVIPLQVDPATQAKLDKIYNQTLSRTYINRAGERVMLSMAYGGDQSDNMGVHKPEVCYGAQGFEISQAREDMLRTEIGTLPVRRLMAESGPRHEPITYWITVGDKAVMPGMDQRLMELKYGLTGTVPDGMLVRVSTLDSNPENAYKIHNSFVNELLRSMDERSRTKLAGVFSGA